MPADQLRWRPGPFHRALMGLPVTFPPTTAPVPIDDTRGAPQWTPQPHPSPSSSTPPEVIYTPRPLRTLISGAFTARRVEALRPSIEEITTTLLDDLAATPRDEPADLRERFAYPLPIEVIGRLFGLPEHLRSGLRETVDGLFSTTITPADAVANQQRLYGLLHDIVDTKRATPADDLTSSLIAASTDDGSRLDEQELVDTLLLMIGAGHETTVNLLDHGIVATLTHPGQLAVATSDPRRWEDVIEETLRWQTPVAHLPLRYAVDDIDCGDGITIRRGQAILASYIAANRDPERYPTPTPSTSTATTRPTSPSATASTSASARPSPAWKPASG